MPSVLDVPTSDGRTVRVHDTGAVLGGAPALVWHTGSPQTGALLDPLVAATSARGIRLVSYGRPSYGGSTPERGRRVAAAAADVAAIADALGLERFAVMGASGGGPHALACAALLRGRVTGAVSISGLAPYTGEDDWFAGMAAPEALRAAAEGQEARERFAETDEFAPDQFTATDWAALEDRWASLGRDAGAAGAAGPEGLIDDDLAFVAPWGFDLADVAVPVLVVHGGADRVVPPAHADAIVHACPTAELWLRPRDGHISVLDACPVAMDWLLAQT
jgi:pimeloyl-ACP methyl ester carboxylesterase